MPLTTPLPSPKLPSAVPLIYHVSGIRGRIDQPAVCLSLYRMYGRDGQPKYTNAGDLRDAFHVAPTTTVILNGADVDRSLERWWSLETSGRLSIIRALRACDIALVGVPNFSLFANVPRWNDLHAMKRIAISHHEFVSEGIPAALHVNGRTSADFDRWGAYIAARPEVTDIAFEFTTGTRHVERRDQYIEWLRSLGTGGGRGLNLLLRGGVDCISSLESAFGQITVLSTNAFMKTTMRQRAVSSASGGVKWLPTPTVSGEALDELLAVNMQADAMMVSAKRTRTW